MRFPDRKMYMLIPDADITDAMVTASTSNRKEDMPLNDSTNMRIVETTAPLNPIFSVYTRKNMADSRIEKSRDGWER